jgi:hypothetical protein
MLLHLYSHKFILTFVGKCILCPEAIKRCIKFGGSGVGKNAESIVPSFPSKVPFLLRA